MSIRHQVSVHCDTCGHWEYGSDDSTRGRRKKGWLIWQDDQGHWCHKCPWCVAKSAGDAK